MKDVVAEIFTERLFIRTPGEEDATKLALFESKNQKYWSSYAATVDKDPSSVSYWTEKLKEFCLECSNDYSFRFLLFDKNHPEGPLIGTCNFTQIFRGPFQACYLGYKIDSEWEGKGLMYEALEQTISYMFNVQNIHRIMANYIPSNQRSERLLARLGFQKEGFANDYLLINGKWEDHILTSLTNTNWKRKLDTSFS